MLLQGETLAAGSLNVHAGRKGVGLNPQRAGKRNQDPASTDGCPSHAPLIQPTAQQSGQEAFQPGSMAAKGRGTPGKSEL